MVMQRFDRNVAFFGEAGQRKMRAMSVAVVGIGGLGTHVVQQLSLLGVGGMVLIDGEHLDPTNFNRYIGVRETDRGTKTQKVDVGERLALCIDRSIRIRKIAATFVCEMGFQAIRDVDFVFGCVDSDAARLVLNEVCSVYERPYIDLASDVVLGEPLRYGGHVCTNLGGDGCVVCLDLVDPAAASRKLATVEELRDRRHIYGVDVETLDEGGPSVVSINGVVASLGITEFMVAATGLRAPQKVLRYRGHLGVVTSFGESASAECYYCKEVRGHPDTAGLERWITKPPR